MDEKKQDILTEVPSSVQEEKEASPVEESKVGEPV